MQAGNRNNVPGCPTSQRPWRPQGNRPLHRKQSQSLDLALRFLDRVDDKCNLYATHPEMGLPRTDLAKVRCFPVSDYVVFYEPHRGGIRLLLVVHGSRDVPSVFRDRFGEPTD